MLDKQFYVTLPSNSSKDVYGVQPINHYKTKLPVPLDLDVDEWEVGLSEIVHPESRITLPESIDIKLGVVNTSLDVPVFRRMSTSVPRGDYKTNRALIDAIQASFDRIIPKLSKAAHGDDSTNRNAKINIIFDRSTGKTRIKGYRRAISMVIPKEIGVLLGFGDTDIIITSTVLLNKIKENPRVYFPVTKDVKYLTWSTDIKEQVVSEFNIDTRRGQRMLYVYSPIVADQFVGDTRVPLLRALPLLKNIEDTQSIRYDNVYYLPLSRSNIHDIEIYITDDTGRFVPFENGRVIVVLHFRKTI